MKYNVKSFFGIQILVLPLLLFEAATEAFIYKMDFLVNEKTRQRIICLSDYHGNPDLWKSTENENIAKTQQANIIAFAKKLDATILIEAPEASILQHFTKKQEKRMLQEVPEEVANKKIKSPLKDLYRHCIVNNVQCKNIECRISPNCFDPIAHRTRFMTLQEVFDRTEQTAKEIAKFNDKKPFKKIYRKELNNFNTDSSTFKEFLNKLGKHGNTSVNELIKLIKNKQISFSDYALLTLVNFFESTIPFKTTTPINTTACNHSHLQPNEISELVDFIAGFP